MQKIRGSFYNDVILEICRPKIINVSTETYVAETFSLNGNLKVQQHPFIIAHPVEITLRVVPFYNPADEITWTFMPGERPIPLLKVIGGHADNSISIGIQIGY